MGVGWVVGGTELGGGGSGESHLCREGRREVTSGEEAPEESELTWRKGMGARSGTGTRLNMLS
jgi:hypothetical protein